MKLLGGVGLPDKQDLGQWKIFLLKNIGSMFILFPAFYLTVS